MPVSENKRYDFDVPCANPDCVHPANGRVAGSNGEVLACANHILDETLNWITSDPGKPGLCMACGEDRAVYEIDTCDYVTELCRGHTINFFAVALSPDAYRRLAEDAGDPEDVYLLHSDFYTGLGVAIQPQLVAVDSLNKYLAGMTTLPWYNPDEGYEIERKDHKKMRNLLQKEWDALVGLELDEDMAEEILTHAIMGEEYRRKAASFGPSDEVRDQMRDHLKVIFQKADPLGIVKLGVEKDAYHRHAAHLSRCIHGSQEETPRNLIQRIGIGFGHYPPISESLLPTYEKLAQTIYLEISLPLQLGRYPGIG